MAKQRTALAAIAGLTIIEVVALAMGIDGVLFSLVVTTLGAIGGANLPRSLRRKLGGNS